MCAWSLEARKAALKSRQAKALEKRRAAKAKAAANKQKALEKEAAKAAKKAETPAPVPATAG